MLKKINIYLLLALISLSFLGGFSLFDSENFNNHKIRFIFISIGCSIIVIYSPLEKIIRKIISILKTKN